jgi:hypothetical protein
MEAISLSPRLRQTPEQTFTPTERPYVDGSGAASFTIELERTRLAEQSHTAAVRTSRTLRNSGAVPGSTFVPSREATFIRFTRD